MIDVDFITGIKADRRYGFSVYENDLYKGLKDKVNFNVISRTSLPLSRTLKKFLSLELLLIKNICS